MSADGALAKVIDIVLGRAFRPGERHATLKAEADTLPYVEEKKQEAMEIAHRAELRRQAESVWFQANLEMIAAKATDLFPSDAVAREPELDWLVAFSEHAQKVSSESVQGIWARILAGEIQEPGSYSKRTLNFVSLMSRREADAFTRIAPFVLTSKKLGTGFVVVRGAASIIVREAGCGRGHRRMLESLGLLADVTDVTFDPSKTYSLVYFGKVHHLRLKPLYGAYKMEVQTLTPMGIELLPICGASPREDFLQEFLTDSRGGRFQTWADGEPMPGKWEGGAVHDPLMDMIQDRKQA